MSLTSFLQQRDVRARFRQEFFKPKLLVDKTLLAPPISKRYSLVGTAFDYLLRFYVERRNPGTQTGSWVATAGLGRLEEKGTFVTTIYENDEYSTEYSPQHPSAVTAFDSARSAYLRYIKSGRTTEALLKGAIYLAQLDTVYRSGWVDENLGVADHDDVRDLRNLLAIVKANNFRVKKRCILNPTFLEGSHLIGGADADIIIDDVLIEIKTTKNFRVTRDDFNQLIGYFILNQLYCAKRGRRITKFAIYFSRHAHLEVYDAARFINPRTYPEFIKWFMERAKLNQPSLKDSVHRKRVVASSNGSSSNKNKPPRRRK